MKGAMASDDKVRAALDRLDRDGDEHGVVEIISAHIDHLTAEVSRLEISLGEEQHRHAETRDELAEVTQTWTDDDENVWEVPTAWAYAQSCRVREELRAEASRLTTEVKVLSDALHLANSEVSRLEGERDALLDLLGQARPCVWHAMAAAVNEPVAQKAEALLTAIDTARGDG